MFMMMVMMITKLVVLLPQPLKSPARDSIGHRQLVFLFLDTPASSSFSSLFTVLSGRPWRLKRLIQNKFSLEEKCFSEDVIIISNSWAVMPFVNSAQGDPPMILVF